MDVTAGRYLTAFRCLAADCPDTCCKGWRVVVDQKHHDLLQAKLPPDEAARGLRRIDEGGNPVRYALTVLTPDGGCTFLDGGLCSVQARFGEDHLPDGCAMYPRIIGRVGKRYEVTATVSCPEIARLVVADDAALEMVPGDRASVARGQVSQKVEPDAEPAFSGARGRVLELLSMDRYPVGSRLFFVATLATRGHVIPDDLHGDLEAFRPGAPFAMSVVREILTLPAKMMPAGFVALLAELGPLDDDPVALDAAHGARMQPPWLDAALGRYARHYVQREWLTRATSFKAYAIGLLARVAVLRFVVTAHPDPSPEILVRAIVGLTRLLEHDRPLADDMIRSLEGQGMTSLEHAACLAVF